MDLILTTNENNNKSGARANYTKKGGRVDARGGGRWAVGARQTAGESIKKVNMAEVTSS